MSAVRAWVLGLVMGVVVSGAISPAALAGDPKGVFSFGARPARSAMVTAPEAPEPGEEPHTDAPMLDRLRGVLAHLDARDLATLRRSAKPAGSPDGLEPFAVVHMRLGERAKRAQILHAPTGTLYARDPDDADSTLARLDRDVVGELMLGWAAPVPMAPVETGESGEVVEITGVPGRLTLTDAVVAQRYTIGRRSRRASGIPPMGRDLSDESLLVRTPEGLDPRRSAGVLVWISYADDPWTQGESRLFGPALDELGIILVTARDIGNERPILDRLQIAIDAVETVRRSHLVDDDRVYVTGMSGGGRCASILVCCFPEVFAGAVPIVGLNSWHRVDLPDGRYIPGLFARPARDRLDLVRTRRIRSITGDADFNAVEMRERTRQMRDAELEIELDDYPGMDHEMPTSERFAAALRWVDEPWRERRVEAESQGTQLMRAHLDAFGEGHPSSPEARASLVVIAAEAPWTDEAWQAAAWLGYDVPGR